MQGELNSPEEWAGLPSLDMRPFDIDLGGAPTRSISTYIEIKTIQLYFHAFCNPNIKFFTSHNLVSLVTPGGLINTWNNHYPPIRFSATDRCSLLQ